MTDVADHDEGQRRWLDDVVDAFRELNGIATYSQLYPAVQRRRKGQLPPNWEASVRREVEQHSSDSQAYTTGMPDLFFSVDGIGRGRWGLRNNAAPAAVLVTYNPAKWDWTKRDADARSVASGKRLIQRWSVGNTQSIPVGTRIFLLQQGEGERGLIASGWTTALPAPEPHWDSARRANGETALYVYFSPDRLLTTNEKPVDPRSVKTGPLATVHWGTPRSGIGLSQAATDALENFWAANGGTRVNSIQPLVLAAQEETSGGEFDHWKDIIGTQYHFPNKYRNLVQPGRPFVYYRGVRRTGGRRGAPEYFGCGRIGDVWRDPDDGAASASDRRWYCSIEAYRPFDTPVAWKIAGTALEAIKPNQFRDGVRNLPFDAFQQICSNAKASVPPSVALILPPINSVVATAVPPGTSLLRQPVGGGTQGSSSSGAKAPRRRSPFSNEIGKQAELIVFAELQRQGKKKLRHHSVEGETPGYDISYDEGGERVAVEVKGTGGDSFANFELTEGERTAAAEMGDQYRLWFVSGVRTTNVHFEELTNPSKLLTDCVLTAAPLLWRVVRGVTIAAFVLVGGACAETQSTDVTAVVQAAAVCRQAEMALGPELNCEFKLPDGPTFSVNDVGGPAATFAVSKASERDRYYVMLSFLHRCIVVGDRRYDIFSEGAPFSFVSLANGKVYGTYKECGATYQNR